MAGYVQIEPNEVYLDWSGGSEIITLNIDSARIGNGWEINTSSHLWCEIQIGERYSNNTYLTVNAPQNPEPSIRILDLEIMFDGDVVGNLYIEQEAGDEVNYSYSVAPTSLSYTADGESKTLTLITDSPYSWNVYSKPTWITYSFSGNKLNVTASANNTYNIRTGNIVVRCGNDFTETVTVSQAAAEQKTTSISNTNVTIGSGSSSTASVTLNASYNAEWSVFEENEWCSATISGNNSRNAILLITTSVANNSTSTRTGTLNVTADNGDTYTITLSQNGATAYSNVTPQYWEIGADGDIVEASLTANWGASWSTQNVPDWIGASIGKNYTNNAVLTLNVSANRMATERVATFTVKNEKKSFNIGLKQATNGYKYTVSPTSLSYNSAGGTEVATISANGNETYSVYSKPDWCTVTFEGNGTSSTKVNITAAANSSTDSRTGIVNIKTDNGSYLLVNISQTGVAKTTNKPQASVSIGNSVGATANVDLSANYNCLWSAYEEIEWCDISFINNESKNTIMVISTTVVNGSINTRTGSITLTADNGDVYTISITQNASSPYSNVTPQYMEVGNNGNELEVELIANWGASWSTQNVPDWINASIGNNYTNNAVLTLNVSENVFATDRVAVFVVKNEYKSFNVSVNQVGAGYSYHISPTTLLFGNGAEDKTVTLTANGDATYSVYSKPDWCTVTFTGNGTNSVTGNISVIKNDSASDRIGTIVFTPDEGATLLNCTISQGAAAKTYSVEPTSIVVNGNGGACIITCTSNGVAQWSILNRPESFIGYSWDNQNAAVATLTLTFGENTFDRQRNGSIIISADNAIYSIEVPVKQLAKNDVNIKHLSNEIDSRAQTITVTANTNYDTSWSVIDKPDWCNCSTSVYMPNYEWFIDIKVNELTTTDDRIGYVSVKDTSGTTHTITVKQRGIAKTTSISPTSLSVASGETSDTITLTANYNCKWTITADNVDWLSSNASEITSTVGTLIVSTKTNYSNSTKNANVYINADNGDRYTLPVSKASGIRKFGLDKNVASIEYNGGTINFTLTTNYPTTPLIDNDNNWFSATVSKVNDNSYIITADVNSTDKADIKVGTFKVYDNYNSIQVTITQTGADKWYKIEPTTVKLGYSGKNDGVVKLMSNWNSKWNYSYDCDWIKVTQTAEEGENYNNNLIINPEFNDGDERRTEITVIKENNPDIVQTVYVVQSKYEIMYFLLENNELVFPYKGGTQSIRILKKDNVSNITVNGNDWCSATVSGDYINVTVSPYSGERETELDITAINNDSTLTITIKIYQRNGNMVSIWKDYFVKATSVEDSIMYNISKNGELIYKGMLHKNPETGEYNIYINDIVSNYLNNKFVFSATTNYQFVMEDYIAAFSIVQDNGTPIANDYYFNDWSYTTYVMDYSSNLVPLRNNVNDIVDSRQYFIQSFLNKNKTNSITANNGIFSTSIQPAQAVTMVSKNPANGTDLTKQCYANLTSAGKTYKVMNTGKDYCIYYKNSYGGYDWLVIDGIAIPSSSIKKSVFRQRANNGQIEFSKVNYQNDVTDKIQFNTGFLKDIESERLENLFTSTEIYVHNLKTGEIKTGIITDSTYTKKTYRNQGCKYFNHTFSIELSNMRIIK